MEIKINSVGLENSEKLYATEIYVEMLVWKVWWVLNFKGLCTPLCERVRLYQVARRRH